VAAWSDAYTDTHGLGAIDPTAWERSIAFMTTMPDSPVANPVTAADAITTELLPTN
jgi:hypothetical protein